MIMYSFICFLSSWSAKTLHESLKKQTANKQKKKKNGNHRFYTLKKQPTKQTNKTRLAHWEMGQQQHWQYTHASIQTDMSVWQLEEMNFERWFKRWRVYLHAEQKRKIWWDLMKSSVMQSNRGMVDVWWSIYFTSWIRSALLWLVWNKSVFTFCNCWQDIFNRGSHLIC